MDKIYLEVGLCVVLATVGDTTSNFMKPAGPKMCEVICNHMIGCLTFVFVTSDLSCNLSHAKAAQLATNEGIYRFKAAKNKERFYAEKEMHCKQDAKLFHSRRSGLQCSKPKQHFTSDIVTKKPLCKQTRYSKMSRLLILPFTRTKNTFQGLQLCLYDNTVSSYPYITTRQATAVAYSSSFHSLIYATGAPYSLVSVTLDSHNKSILENRYKINALTVDDTNLLVFIATEKPVKGVRKLKLKGKRTRLVINLRTKLPFGIAVDPKRKMVYVSCTYNDMILKMSYRGKNIKQVVIGKVGNSLKLDLKRDFLYYNMRKAVWRMSLSDHSSTTVKRLPFPVKYFIYIGNNLYLVRSELRKIFFVVKGKNVKNIVLPMTISNLQVCPIP